MDVRSIEAVPPVVEHNGTDQMIFKHAVASIKSPRTIGNYYTTHES